MMPTLVQDSVSLCIWREVRGRDGGKEGVRESGRDREREGEQDRDNIYIYILRERDQEMHI